MTKLHRSQILLERRQYERLSQLAQEEERSMSGLVREAVEEYVRRREAEQRTRQRLAAVDKADRLRADIRRERGGRPLSEDWGEWIRRVRDERDQQVMGSGDVEG